MRTLTRNFILLTLISFLVYGVSLWLPEAYHWDTNNMISFVLGSLVLWAATD